MSSDESSADRRVSARAVFIFIVLAAAYFYCSTQRISAGVVLPHMGATYGFSAALVGFLSSLFFYTYGFIQNIWGSISDRVGPMRSCAVGLAVAGAGSLLVLVSHSPLVIGLSRLVTGFGLAAIFTGIYLYAALAFPLAQYPFWVGMILVAGNLGTVAAVAPLGWMMDRLGYDGLYLVLGLFAFALSALLWLLRRHAPPRAEGGEGEDAGDPAAGPGERCRRMARDIGRGFRLVVGYRPLWVVVFVWATISASIACLQGLWGVSWLSASSGVDLKTARFWVTFVSAGLVAGSPLGARMTLRSGGGRSGILRTMAGLSAAWLLYMLGAWRGCPAPLMGAIGFAIGTVTGMGMVFCSSSVKALAPISRTGLVIGTAQMFIYLTVILCQWGSGVIINQFPGGGPGNYLNRGYLIGFGAIALVVLVSLFSILNVPSFRRAEDGRAD